MKKTLSLAAIAAALLVGTAMSSSAATITNLATLGAVTADPQLLPTYVSGNIGPTLLQLSYTADYVSFTLNRPPTTVNTKVDVNVLAGSVLPGETWRICATANCNGGPEGSGSASNSPVVVALAAAPAGSEYFLEFATTGAPSDPTGKGQWNLAVPGGNVGQVPLPGALALFAGGLGLLGFTTLRKRRGAGVSPLSAI